MFIKPFEWMIAKRYLRAHREERFISVIAILSVVGIALGVGVLIIVMSVMNGFQATMVNQIIGINGHLLVQGTSEGLHDYENVAKDIAAFDGVVQVRPMIQGQVMVTYRDRSAGAVVRGVNPADYAKHELLTPGKDTGLISGDPADFQGDDAILLGEHLARNLGVRVGDVVTLIAPQTTATPFGSAPRMRDYMVTGLFNIGVYEYNANFIFMPLSQAQIHFKMKQAVSGLDVELTHPDIATQVQYELIPTVPPTSRVLSWRDLNASFVGALEVERNTMFIILTLIIIIAAFNIMSSLIMLVKDKRKDIAVLRTMGARRRSIMKIFVICGGLMGMGGTLAGVILGFSLLQYREAILGFLGDLFNIRFFPPDVYGLEALPSQTDPAEVIFTVVLSLTLSLVATLYPSWRAARMDPVEALRYE
ncbi:MAG: lipoprotein-releasing ABC transporter permease subunit [Alphaproteobacteria bacterium]|nr:MAG: lipoprotein-releasing ABC transporter permease subunit [Alphaproteobacteria bacterium]